jgi:hypothetical protein
LQQNICTKIYKKTSLGNESDPAGCFLKPYKACGTEEFGMIIILGNKNV